MSESIDFGAPKIIRRARARDFSQEDQKIGRIRFLVAAVTDANRVPLRTRGPVARTWTTQRRAGATRTVTRRRRRANHKTLRFLSPSDLPILYKKSAPSEGDGS